MAKNQRRATKVEEIDATGIEQRVDRPTDHKLDHLRALLARAQMYSQFLADRLREQILVAGHDLDESLTTSRPGQRRGRSQQQLVMATATNGFMQPKTMVGGTLRGYQLEGVQWLVSLFENGLNGILADEMGLGKTVQCIAFLAFLREQGVMGPFLIIAPLSTISNWMAELERFTPSIPALMYHGSQVSREEMRSTYLDQPGANIPSVLVTSYEIAMRDARYLGRISWKYMIIDEGHRLKNLNCRLIRELKTYKSDNRLLLTGTPLQNNLTELWSLLNFLLPDIFTDVADFLGWFDLDLDLDREHGQDHEPEALDSKGIAAAILQDERTEMISKLHAILKPLLLRRLKVDVEKDLPRKREYILSASLSPLQWEYYQLVLQGKARQLVYGSGERTDDPPLLLLNRNHRMGKKKRVNYLIPDEDDIEFVEERDKSRMNESSDSKPVHHSRSCAQGLQNRIMQLRKVCNHPFLFLYPTRPNDPTMELLVDEQIVQCSGKMRLLDQLLGSLRQRGHKVLIFSQMSRMLDILESFLDLRGIEHCRIDGSVSQSDRQEQMDRFNSQPSVGVFLLSTRAGGLGLNLVSADTVIFYDSDWVDYLVVPVVYHGCRILR